MSEHQSDTSKTGSIPADLAGDPKSGDPVSAAQHLAEGSTEDSVAAPQTVAGDPKSGDPVSAAQHLPPDKTSS